MSTVLMIGDAVDVSIGRAFLPNQTGGPITLNDRVAGTLTHWDQYGNAVVLWPNGESYSYEPAILRKRGSNQP